jgi:anti-sigma regulatory factor (Ser/Thr protein kinase)
MPTMVPGPAAELQACRIRLAPGPAAAAEARGQVRAAIAAWNVPVDADAAVLLASELVTNAVKHAAGETITLGIRCARNRLRVDVHDTSPSSPVVTSAPAGAEAGRGLVLVADLSTEWGFYRTPMGKVVYFTLAFHSDLTGDCDMTSDKEDPHPDPQDEDLHQPSRYEPQRRTNESHGPCKRCGGRGDAHFLWCPLLKLPDTGELWR